MYFFVASFVLSSGFNELSNPAGGIHTRLHVHHAENDSNHLVECVGQHQSQGVMFTAKQFEQFREHALFPCGQ